jgi:hypothetical protein
MGIKVLFYTEIMLIFSTPVLIKHQWQLKTVVFQHWCLIRAVLLKDPDTFDKFPAKPSTWPLRLFGVSTKIS